MPISIDQNNHSGVLLFNKNGESVTVVSGFQWSGLPDPIIEDASCLNNTFNIFGSIVDAQTALTLGGANSHVLIGAQSMVSGQTGIFSTGANLDLTNNGTIETTGISIDMRGKGSVFQNNGTVSNTIAVAADNCTLNLAAGGTTGDIALNLANGWTATVNNYGTIGMGADGFAILSGNQAGADNIYNWGVISGAVSLGAGDDCFFNYGTFNGIVLGGTGNDLYYITGNTRIMEQAGEGNDTIRSTITLSLLSDTYVNAEIENLTLEGTEDLNATGNSLNNILTGNSGDNILDGGDGSDQLFGGDGDDTYILGGGDSVTETNAAASGGRDTIIVGFQYVLKANFENLTLTGTDDIAGYGNDAENIIHGNAGGNFLAGMGGIDTLFGGAGDDTLVGSTGPDRLFGEEGSDEYRLGSSNDYVEDTGNTGIDTAIVNFSWTAATGIENVSAVNAGAVNLTGNGLNNVLTTGDGDNTLDGGAGDDTLYGGDGDDVYIVDSSKDKIIEVQTISANADLVKSTASYTLADNIEYLQLLGNAVSGIGNAGDNIITGNGLGNTLLGMGGDDQLFGGDGDDYLDCGTGNGTLYGGNGNDTFVLRAGTVLGDPDGSGTDTVVLAIGDYTLGEASSIRNIALASGGANATGNAFANIMTGNSANNDLRGKSGSDRLSGSSGDDRLDGGDGGDTLDGGTGVDMLYGGAGDDVYVGLSASDKIFEASTGGIDTVRNTQSCSIRAFSYVENIQLEGTATANATGNGRANVLQGNAANNVLVADAGNDMVYGGGGSDRIEGGKGVDRLTGGAGADLFVFRTGDTGVSRNTADTILDFTSADDIDLHYIDANTKVAGNQAFSFIGTGAFTGKAGELRFVKEASDSWLYTDTNGDRKADFIIHLDDAVNLSKGHFVL